MAIDTWATALIDPSAANNYDASAHIHNWKRATTTGQDISIAFDRNKVKSVTVLRTALLQALKLFQGGNELTA